MPTLARSLDRIQETTVPARRYGRVTSVVGLLVEASELDAAVGEMCRIHMAEGGETRTVRAEVVGVKESTTVLMPMEQTHGLQAGCLIRPADEGMSVPVGPDLLGRVINAGGRPIDGKGPLGTDAREPIHRDPPSPLDRPLIDTPLSTGIRSIDAFLKMGKGQRTGIFSGSGVGKSTLLGMIARRAEADVNVIALIGERGREVREFIVDNLGEEGLRRSVLVAVTGDEAAMSRVKAASAAMAIAEHFRDRGQDVLLMMDSITRVAQAQREIGLAVGEPPTRRGYPPSVFALLPRLLERAGPAEAGTITGIFTVLVEGDDMSEPISDAARGILDGHIVLSRELAEAGHYPAVDVLQSVSRVMPRVASPEAEAAAQEARELLSAYEEVEDLISVGAYEEGSDPETDRAVEAYPALADFLQQPVDAPPPDPAPSTQLRQLLDDIPE
ncbi:FliI/YscN family ATPase [Salinibacter ruber]|uniref:FliI/YscN family ATPase n=1 Tax=Salinibacter ruber TaxID=146919 RepID=UPI001620E92E|nr:FliI/YscN family ATPase [Salinibacter ruber]MBB4090331.1 flagellum-specific ATP synthase [Salinibacter ruber]